MASKKAKPLPVAAQLSMVMNELKQLRRDQGTTRMPKAIRKRRAAASASGQAPRGASGNRPLGGSPLGMRVSSDGLNQSLTMTNNSRIEEKFQVRFEKVTDLVGTTSAFALLTNGQYYINPGNSVLFPIFSKIATTYEQYRVNRLRFHYVTQCYTASGTNVGAGRVMMATNFDPDAGSFTTKTQMENYEKCVAFEPYARHVVHDVMEAHRSRMVNTSVNNYYVSGSANVLTPVTGQAKFYDLGNFQVGGAGMVDATSIIGELWVEYSFTMIRPVQESPIGDSIAAAHYTTVPVTATSRFGTGAQQTGSNLNLTLGANTITLPFAGNFLVVFRASAATSYTDANSISAGTGGSLLAIWNGGASQGISFIGSGTTAAVLATVVACTAPGVVLTVAGTPTIVGAVLGDLWVCQVPSDIVTLLSPLERLKRRVDELAREFGQAPDLDPEWGKDEVKVDSAPTVNMTSSFVRAVMDMAKSSK